MKKAGFVAAVTAALMMSGGVASASPAFVPDPLVGDGAITYAEAVQIFNHGGMAAGQGAAELVSGAWTGFWLTPTMIAESFLG